MNTEIQFLDQHTLFGLYCRTICIGGLYIFPNSVFTNLSFYGILSSDRLVNGALSAYHKGHNAMRSYSDYTTLENN